MCSVPPSDAYLTFIKQGEPLPAAELAEAANIVNEVKQKAGDPARLCELGVKWVLVNPSPIKLSSIDYKR